MKTTPATFFLPGYSVEKLSTLSPEYDFLVAGALPAVGGLRSLTRTFYKTQRAAWTIRLDYPVKEPVDFPHTFKVHHGLLDLGQVLRAAAEDYVSLYATKNKENPYGIWGHGLRDLVFESVTFHKGAGRITFTLGS